MPSEKSLFVIVEANYLNQLGKFLTGWPASISITCDKIKGNGLEYNGNYSTWRLVSARYHFTDMCTKHLYLYVRRDTTIRVHMLTANLISVKWVFYSALYNK